MPNKDLIMIIKNIQKHTKNKLTSGKISLACAIGLFMAAQAQGFEFYAGGLEAKLDTYISMGSSWRVEKQNAAVLNDVNADDGNRNYQKDDTFSLIFKGSNDLELTYENYGAFVRAKYWHDAALENDDNLDDSNNHDLAKYSGAEIFDAFVYGNFEVMDMSINVRLGKQVVSWGESTLILGSLDSINSFDMSAFNRPGAKIKEAVIPVNMAFASVGLTDNLSAEAFYQLEYRETVLDGCGTYFSMNDYAADGCANIKTELGTVSRNSDGVRRPDSDGQFGIAFRYISEELDTEFGFYAMNIHSRNPSVSATKANFDELATLNSGIINADIQGLAYQLVNGSQSTDPTIFNNLDAQSQATVLGEATVGVLASLTTGEPALGIDGVSFYIEYPEDIKIAGLSFTTNVNTLALSGEISHSTDIPIQINSYQLTSAPLLADAIHSATLAGALQQGVTEQQALAAADAAVASELGSLGTMVVATGDGQVLSGFRLFDVTQVQLTAIQLFDQVLGASQIALVAEAGYTYLHDFDQYGDIKFDGTTFESMADTVTESSWGYRALISADYTDVFAGVNLTPEIYWSQDVKGVSSAGGSAFVEGNERLGLTLNANYLNTYNASVSYTRLSGGENNLLRDRDYASISMGMQF
jgi:hypothetical protein